MEWRAQSRRDTLTACMDDMRDAQNTNLANHDEQNLTTGLFANGITRVSIHVLRFMCAVWKVLWGLGRHVVIGVVRLVAPFHHEYAIPDVSFFFLDFVVQLCTCSQTVFCRQL